jgi:undecaprenyl-diphosphatase
MLSRLAMLDDQLMLRAHWALASPAMEAAMHFVSSWSAPLVLLVVPFLIVRDRRKSLAPLTLLLGAVFVSNMVAELLRITIERPRPVVVQVGAATMVVAGHGSAMPSEHAANSAVAVAILVYALCREPGWHARALSGYLIALAILIPFSRVYLQVHRPSDVIVGSLLGLSVALLAIYGLGLLLEEASRRRRLRDVAPATATD